VKVSNIDKFLRGWFIGDFSPSLFKTKDVEVAVQYYKKGSLEQEHFHKIATEITVIVSGKVKINNTVFKEKDIIVLQPNESSIFEVLEDCTTLVVKIPGASNDKYIV
jgi:hypothetical protein